MKHFQTTKRDAFEVLHETGSYDNDGEPLYGGTDP